MTDGNNTGSIKNCSVVKQNNKKISISTAQIMYRTLAGLRRYDSGGKAPTKHGTGKTT